MVAARPIILALIRLRRLGLSSEVGFRIGSGRSGLLGVLYELTRRERGMRQWAWSKCTIGTNPVLPLVCLHFTNLSAALALRVSNSDPLALKLA